MASDRIETKLAAARTKLILDKPFLGALVMRLPMQEANPDWCPATATDARKFYYNPDFIDQLSLDEKNDQTPLDNHVYDQDNTRGSGSGKAEKLSFCLKSMP